MCSSIQLSIVTHSKPPKLNQIMYQRPDPRSHQSHRSQDNRLTLDSMEIKMFCIIVSNYRVSFVSQLPPLLCHWYITAFGIHSYYILQNGFEKKKYEVKRMSINYDPGIIQYMIQPGDTLWDLAGQYGITVEDIMDANPYVDPYNLYVGQVISIPDPPEFRRPFGFRRPFRFRRRFRRPFREFEEFEEFRRRPFREFEEEEEEEEEERERFRRRPFR